MVIVLVALSSMAIVDAIVLVALMAIGDTVVAMLLLLSFL